VTLLAGVSIFAAAFLLFALEPLIAKRLLPWFGGSSAVWSVCLVFYQVALLAGYSYARILTRYLSQSRQVLVHIFLLVISLALLPIGPGSRWKPDSHAQPAWLILEMLTVTIGLPFAVLSATSPLLQHWLARLGDDKPYRFFALSNFASLSALLAYPLLIEPYLNSSQQSMSWSGAFVLFVIVCAVFAWQARQAHDSELEQAQPVSGAHKIYWFLLAACGSMLLLSITNHIDQNVAAVPLLWVLPLAVYLISFIFAFGSNNLYRRWLWLRMLAFGLAMLAYAAYDITVVLPLQITVPVFLAGLFIGCAFCHSELYRLRPSASGLTSFYLTIAAGGAVGAVFVGLIAPQIFGGIYELPLSMAMTAGLALALTWQDGGWGPRVLWIGVSASMVVVFVLNLKAYNQNALALERSFYGSLRVLQSPEPGPDQVRTLYHGTVQHGDQFQWPSRKLQPTTYYGPDSGVGILLREWGAGPRRVAVVGLGAGTLAVYGRPGDTFRFYEINPQVIDLTRRFFTFSQDSQAHVETVQGDARLSLEREDVPQFDVIVLDAFSGDAIPVHLLTREAMDLYTRRLRPGGVMAFHVSNNFLDLAPVVRQLARATGYASLVVQNQADQENMVLASEWVLVTTNTSILDNDDLKKSAMSMPGPAELRIWTDDFNSLLPILKTPEMRQ
jgi:SAM-dependent methyltransferase